jgi:hypothetical protein
MRSQPKKLRSPLSSKNYGFFLGLCLLLITSLPSFGATVWFEGFENPAAFTNDWIIENEEGGPLTNLVSQWGVVNASFGFDDPPKSGSYKAYCAAIGYEGTQASPRYSSTNENWVSMQASFIAPGGDTNLFLKKEAPTSCGYSLTTWKSSWTPPIHPTLKICLFQAGLW